MLLRLLEHGEIVGGLFLFLGSRPLLHHQSWGVVCSSLRLLSRVCLAAFVISSLRRAVTPAVSAVRLPTAELLILSRLCRPPR